MIADVAAGGAASGRDTKVQLIRFVRAKNAPLLCASDVPCPLRPLRNLSCHHARLNDLTPSMSSLIDQFMSVQQRRAMITEHIF